MHSPLHRALALAEHALFLTPPNPRVGCVITGADGAVLGEGHTQAVGGPHAEVMALRDAAARGHDVRGATVWVTLEPCAHHGRTPPCCDALVAAGVGRVVVTNIDPNPRVAGAGIARLRAAGVQVDVLPADDPLARAARALNIGFFSRMERGRPWVRLKIAASADGRTALPNGVSQWITSPEARQDGHRWRARACAVLTGVGTVLADDPRLDARGVDAPRQPHAVVLDSHLRTPPAARLFDVPHKVWIFTASTDAVRRAALEARGAEVISAPAAPDGRLVLDAVAAELARREVNEVHVEAGETLNGALLAAGLADELLLYLAPRLLGAGRGMAALGPYAALDEAPALVWHEATPVGPDLRLRADVAGRERF
ncbi:diaminohydroxyphosphoribosylaminopyrimidine deaminase/5-amino-6-(5-phosphoribosylamino)uracil reductase [Tibeticola sediminis]|uniref:Riboflavin biosynthesis protein RibD n=1 Tax=Tibeticola sediminis TaxID=1917811 RepID=A0A3N4UIM4_9BURK|nr:bifunctional diaminohydroxyphosphoribosylaminopyrimidine deaminase/5-amino-6-(5-phosphoribosylamino)uracil reductase RibD [Tibeticola sediminis]RPE64957.1 diaminohydroxyphosphoribosylaminopyrimidine deaminase/5-amino-6-(5-phosphoribosylamino)uracil reductase [Tibeticola sediminis]